MWVGPAYTHLTAYVEHSYQHGGIPVVAIQDGNNMDTESIGVDLTDITEDRATAGCNGDTDGYQTHCYEVGGGVYWNWIGWSADRAYFTDSAWHFVEAFFQINTTPGGVGATDGMVRYWFYGTLIIDHQDVLLRTGAQQTIPFNQFIFAPYFGDGSPVDQTMYVDDLLVAIARP